MTFTTGKHYSPRIIKKIQRIYIWSYTIGLTRRSTTAFLMIQQQVKCTGKCNARCIGRNNNKNHCTLAK